jgi:hypothetical protein
MKNNMKKIYLYLIILVAALSFNACADSEYTDIYSRPSEISKASVDKLMTGVFYTGRTFTFNAYWRVWIWDNNVTGTYAQTVSCIRDNGQLYAGVNGESYAQNRWVDFYNTLTQFRVLENVYNELDDNQKPSYSIYKDLAEVFVYDHLSQVVDIWGDVPFKEAGTLYITGDVISSKPAYDNAVELYTTMLDRLGELSSSIAGATAPAALVKQDFINDGSLDKWERYANSLRLRLAVRVARNGALADKGKQVIVEILNGNKKLVDSYENIIALPSNNDDTANFFNPDDLRTGYIDANYYNASLQMLNALNAFADNQDPRLPFLYSKNAAGEYKGFDRTTPYAEISTNVNKQNSERVYSRIDSTTVGYNTKFISPIVTAAEVYFLKAEAYQAGLGVGSDAAKAKTEFVAGVKHAAEFVFNENKISPSTDGYKPATYPELSTAETYAITVWDAATDKHKAIIQQRWLNFGYFQSSQAWNEIRRVGYSYLGFSYPVDNEAQVLKNVPNRIYYPSKDRDYNTENWKAATGGTDDYYKKIFWAD